MSKFKNKYRIPSARLENWNYAAAGSYFITICTRNRAHYFGEIVDDEMQLTELGKIAETEWLKTIDMRPDMNLEMGEFIVMPNHFHAIIIIGDNEFNRGDGGGGGGGGGRDAMHRVSTSGASSATGAAATSSSNGINTFGPQSKNLASILRGFKSAVTTQARKMGNKNFEWQERYHDHIIRNWASFERIQYYIANNPAKWKEDTFNNDNPSPSTPPPPS